MILIQATRIKKSFGGRQVLDGGNLAVAEGERVGLVGVNGAGKSTLLKILAGAMEPDSGEVVRAKGLTMAYLAQDSGGLSSSRTLREEMLSVFTPLMAMEQELRLMEKQMETGAAGKQLLEQYALVSARFKEMGGFTYESSIRAVLKGLKLGEADENTPVDLLSGGQKTRLALARCLLAAPQLLILDEPTNYLDLDHLRWLEQYLKEYRGAVLAVSHDRYFLDAVVKTVYELENGRLTRYTGNYTAFAAEKAARREIQAREYARQQAEIARLEDFVRRNMAAKDTAGRAKSRQKALAKMERVEKPFTARQAAFSFEINHPGGSRVLQVQGLSIGYRNGGGPPGTPGDTVLASNINFEIARGERVALLGPNGTGKTTHLKTIAGLLPPLEGSILPGYHLQTGYYDQEQRGLNPDKDVLNELWDRYPHLEEVRVRTVLGGFLFSGDDVFKKVADLSGGEKSRLALAALMLKKANFLLLDEPTNHLDLPAREVLENALAGYPGTILFVSHDRYFINRIATRVLELQPDGVVSHPGSYDDYTAKKAETAAPAGGAAGPARDGQKDKTAERELYLRRKEEERYKRKTQKRIEELEKAIAGLEERIARLQEELYLPEVYRDALSYRERERALAQARSELDGCLEQWLRLVEDSGT
ncbi:MAG: ABC-F family ATP-binding cassette domain-containing protein [Firmicutes bacterium]|nr:ABC-F family ATP-binding cassette domain-containing protein [Bacillota bacterium]